MHTFCRTLGFCGDLEIFPRSGKNCVILLEEWNILHFSSEGDRERCSDRKVEYLDLNVSKMKRKGFHNGSDRKWRKGRLWRMGMRGRANGDIC